MATETVSTNAAKESMPKKRRSTGKKVFLGIVIALVACVVIIAGYVGYCMITYYRLPDNLSLDVEVGTEAQTQILDPAVNKHLVITTDNLGFGAYTPDYTFFMDGGTQSWGESAEIVANDITSEGTTIASLNPDFALFQEVDIDGDRSYHMNQYDMLKKIFPTYDSTFAQNYDSPWLALPLYQPHGKTKAGLVSFSHYTMDDAVRRSFPISDSLSKFLDLDRCFAVNRVPLTNGHDLVFINVHMSAYGASDEIMDQQCELLFSVMQEERDAGNYVIAGGDFNHDLLGYSNEEFGNDVEETPDWAQPFDFDKIPAGFTLGTQWATQRGEHMTATCRDTGVPLTNDTSRWIMDGFIFSDNVQCEEYNTHDLNFAYSDHNPVVMTFSLEEE